MGRVTSRCRSRVVALLLASFAGLPGCTPALGGAVGTNERSVTESAAVAGAPTPQRPSIASQTVMLYYDDLARAEKFFGETIGLEKTHDFGWVKFFRVSAGAEIGIVKAGPGAYFKPQPRNAVMLSIVTDEVDAWYARLKADPAVVFLVDIHTAESAPIRNFMVQDPGGYAVEFFQWLQQP